MTIIKPISFLTFILILSGCGGDSDNDSTSKSQDQRLRDLIEEHQLTGDPSTGRDLPSIEEPKAQLGMHLFYSKALGGDQDTACVTCHHPALGGGDNLSLPIGVGADNPALLGAGRTHDGETLPTVPRNAPTTFNIALWDQFLFHDGRAEALSKIAGQNGAAGGIRTPDSDSTTSADPLAGTTLTAAQARFPVTSAAEMRGTTFEAGNGNQDVRDHLAARLSNTGEGAGEILQLDSDSSGVNDWVEQFELVYASEPADTLITYERIADAIAAYERSQVFVNNPWKSYVQGNDSALSDSQKQGAELFFNTVENGGANCVACHSGDFFTDEQFKNIAMIQVGEGKGDGPDGSDDFGRFRETKELSDKYAFRTPSLLNVEVTGPFGHTGAFDRLESVIRHHLDPQSSIDAYFSNNGTWCQNMAQLSEVTDCDEHFPSAEFNTRQAMEKLSADRSAGQNVIQNVDLTDSQITNLVAFMGALTDPCLKDAECLGQWIPSTNTLGVSDLQINGVDQNAQPLTVNQ